MKDLSKIEDIYHAVLQRPMHEREDFLREICKDDFALRREVESLLSFDEKAENFIETPPNDLAAALFTKQNNKDILGKTLNHYHILSLLGSGGMGEVYLAEDTKLARKVALKLLPSKFSQDAERKSRFEREARAVSALNHPNIITIFSIEQIENYNFIATEFIDGKTLREKIAEKTLTWQESVEIGIQIAGALESAHSVGIIHRDIKPANVMIRQDGYVKVLDFGLAKLLQDNDISNSENKDETGRGTVMGTINYMSPEQALGENIDTRSDIFSLGVVLYEMLSGVQPFNGNSDAAIYNATINRNPPSLIESNAEIPRAFDEIIRKAIEKKRENRYQTATDLRRDLQNLKQNSNSNISTKNFAESKGKLKFAKLIFPIAAAVIFLSLAAYFLFFNRILTNQTAEAKNFNYTQLTSQSGEELFPNLSPDGKTFIYASRESGNLDIYFQRVGGSNPINLTKDSAADDKQAVYSPNSNEIAFRSERDGGGIFIMGATGENVRKISEVGFYPNWSPDGKEIVFCEDDFIQPGNRPAYPSELWRIKIETGDKVLITKQDAVQPSWSPNGKWIAFWGLRGAQRDVWIISADGGEPVSITDDAATDWNPVWSPDGKYLYYASNRSGTMNLWQIMIDEDSGKVLKNPEPITLPSSYSQFFSFGKQGSFVYAQASTDLNIWRVDFDSANEAISQKTVQITNDSRIKTDPNLSPDNQNMVFASVGSQNEDLYLAKLDGSGIRLLTNTPYKERLPVWSPDGKKIAFLSNKSGGEYEGWLINADGNNLQRITSIETTASTIIPVWSPDGKSLLFSSSKTFPSIFNPEKSFAEQTPIRLPEDKGKLSYMASSWSLDGKKLVGYSSDANSSKEYITVYDLNTRQYRDLTDIGGVAYWLSDNRRLIFCNEDKIYLLDTLTKKLKELLSVKPNIIDSIAISKDNRSIYYALQKKESDIWLANTQ